MDFISSLFQHKGGVYIKKLISITLFLFSVIILLMGCGEKSNEVRPACDISTASGASIEANWYEGESFNFGYDKLTELNVSGPDTLIFTVNWDAEILTIGEDYYEYPSKTTGMVHHETYELIKNDDNAFTLNVQNRNNIRDEKAIYYIVNKYGKFVIRVLFPTAEIIT